MILWSGGAVRQSTGLSGNENNGTIQIIRGSFSLYFQLFILSDATLFNNSTLVKKK